MAYALFGVLDYPVSRLYQLPIFVSPVALMTVLGGCLWFLYGFVLQGLFSISSFSGVRRLSVGLLLLGLVCIVPELRLKTLPLWEEHWYRGTAAREAHNLDEAIRHVSEAVRVSPKENSILDSMWDYLGSIYLERNDYAHAGAAFTNALAAAIAKPNSRPVDVLNAYNQLAQFYERTKDKQREKDSLRKAVDFNRIVYGGDSQQESNCWYRLAVIAHEDGDSTEAQALIERAIRLHSTLRQQDTWKLNYMKDQLKKWTAK